MSYRIMYSCESDLVIDYFGVSVMNYLITSSGSVDKSRLVSNNHDLGD